MHMVNLCYRQGVSSELTDDSGDHELPFNAVLGSRTGYRLIRLGECLKVAAKHALAPLGLRPRHFDVLLTLATQDPQSQLDVSRALGLDPNVMVGLVDDLEHLGLAARQRNPDDRRRHVVVVTDAGRALLRDSATVIDAAEEEFFSAIAAEDRAVLHRLAGTLLAVNEPAAAQS